MRRLINLSVRYVQYRSFNRRLSYNLGEREGYSRNTGNRYPRTYQNNYGNRLRDNNARQSTGLSNPGFLPPHVWSMQRDGLETLQLKLFPPQKTHKDDACESTISTGTANISGSSVDASLSYEVVQNFTDLPLDQKLMDNLRLMNLKKMTPIQMHTIPLLMKNPSFDISGSDQDIASNIGMYDLMAAAQTGSGKTLAYLIPLFQRLMCTYPHHAMQSLADANYYTQYPSALVLAPTRELTQQICQEMFKLCYRTHVRSVALYGGEKPFRQTYEINRGCHVIVATPGRLTDFLNQQLINLSHCRTLIIDEADRMLDMGFEPQLRRIIETRAHGMPPAVDDGRQTALFSATFPSEVAILARDFLRGSRCISLSITSEDREGVKVPVWGQAVRRASSEDTFRQLKSTIPKEIKQEVELLHTNSPFDMLQALAERVNEIMSSGVDNKPSNENNSIAEDDAKEEITPKIITKNQKSNDRILIFCNTQLDANRVDLYLMRQGFKSVCVHGGRSQAERTENVLRFRDGHANVLVATSVAARGLDFPNVKAVINFSLPLTLDDYVHRIGRTGRMGKKGLAVTLIGFNELSDKTKPISVVRGVCRLVHASDPDGCKLPDELVRAVGWRVGMDDGEGAENGNNPYNHHRSSSRAPRYSEKQFSGSSRPYRSRNYN